MVEEIGLPDLTYEQIEDMCNVADAATKSFIFSHTSPDQIVDLDVTIDIKGTDPLNVIVDVMLVPTPPMEKTKVDSLVEGAVEEAVRAVERKVREFASCKFKK